MQKSIYFCVGYSLEYDAARKIAQGLGDRSYMAGDNYAKVINTEFDCSQYYGEHKASLWISGN
jgi:hypothetical protein